ncbi:hypothetical protein ScPMuIL_014272 [Solemya velum]
MGSIFGAAALPLIACVALLVAATLQILGFASPYWSHDGTRYTGLWREGECLRESYYDCYKFDITILQRTPDYLHAVRGLESLGIIFLAIPLITLPVYMYIALGMYYRCMLGSMCVSSLLSAVTIIIGVIIYALEIADQNKTVAWSLFVCIVGGACSFIGFLVLLIAIIVKRPVGIKEAFTHRHCMWILTNPNCISYKLRIKPEILNPLYMRSILASFQSFNASWAVKQQRTLLPNESTGRRFLFCLKNTQSNLMKAISLATDHSKCFFNLFNCYKMLCC